MATKEIHDHLTAFGHLRKRSIMFNNFLGGLAWGFGTVVGATMFVALLAWVLKLFGVFDNISGFFPQMYK